MQICKKYLMMNFWMILAIGSGGFIGALLRAYLSPSINKLIPHALPFGTLSVNLIGSFILGSLYAYFAYTDVLSEHVKSFLSVGMMGALTTYSTFAMESFTLFSGGNFLLGLLNIALNTIGCIFCAGGGYKVFELLLK